MSSRYLEELVVAIQSKNIPKVKWILGELKKNGKWTKWDTFGATSTTVVHLAVRGSSAADLEILELLLKALPGCHSPIERSTGCSPLLLAAKNGNYKALELLLRAGASPSERNKDGLTPLHLAARNGKVEVIKMLFEYGADASQQDRNLSTPLHWA